MKSIYKKLMFLFLVIILIAGGVLVSTKIQQKITDKKNGIGKVLDSYKGVDVFYNGGDYSQNHGKNYSKDGSSYYYGYKWQCVEYIKRFYYEAQGHKMPDVYGNAKDFFDDNLEHGMFNEKRGLTQYKNGEDEKPKIDDILIFTDTTYGHIVIITEVGDNYIEVIQQNMGDSSRDRFELEYKEGKYFVGGKRVPAGWLREV